MRRKDKELVPIAEFADADEAEPVWAKLEDEGIPASIVSDPEIFGKVAITRVWVERFNHDAAERIVAELLADREE